jgi:aryl-alcohol dehydrogenase-like predicted oxidoreductase
VTVARRSFGNSGVMVSEIGLGCGGYWGFRAFPEERAAEIVDLALEHGVNLMDTGPNYSDGNAEPRLGRILAGRREQVFLATKVGSRLERGRVVKDWSAGGIRASVEASLVNLRTDHIDLVQLHSPSPDVLDDEGTLGALAALKSKGLVTFLGLSTDPKLAARAIELGVFDCVMITYNVLHQRSSGRVAEIAAAAGRAVLARSPMAHVVYEPSLFRPTSRARIWYLLRALKNFRRDLARARSLRFLRDLEGWPGPRAALRFVLENPCVTSAIVGTTDPRHLVDNLSVSNGPPLPSELFERLLRVDS